MTNNSKKTRGSWYRLQEQGKEERIGGTHKLTKPLEASREENERRRKRKKISSKVGTKLFLLLHNFHIHHEDGERQGLAEATKNPQPLLYCHSPTTRRKKKIQTFPHPSTRPQILQRFFNLHDRRLLIGQPVSVIGPTANTNKKTQTRPPV